MTFDIAGSESTCEYHAVTQALMAAAEALPLPLGTAFSVVPVTPFQGIDLPQSSRNWTTRRRNSFASGRRAARMALMTAGHSGAALLGIGSDRLPDWPEGWWGSISHTDTIAVAVVIAVPGTSAAMLGIDVERMISDRVAEEIAALVMPEGVPDAGIRARADTVTRAFSAKEALYKALFPQVRTFKGFDAARVLWSDRSEDRPLPVSLELTENWGSWQRGTIVAVRQAMAADHVLTLIGP